MAPKETGFIRGRLKQPLAREVQETLALPIWSFSHEHLFRPMNHINLAHTLMLEERGLITPQEARALVGVLLDLEAGDPSRIQPGSGGEFYLDLERCIINEAGEGAGGKLHIGRSRNDLLATAQKMALRDPLDELIDSLLSLMDAEAEIGERYQSSVMPGYTHLQQAQPITLGFYLVGHSEAIGRDIYRLERAQHSLDECPLGAGALAGVTFDIDRHRTAALLGFQGPVPHALDAVASRDYALDIVYGLAVAACNLSRLAEDLYLWNTYEFGFLEISDEYAEISSIMPQKKNPFVIEHCRAKAGSVYGNLMAILTTLKGVPFTHCRDASGEFMPQVYQALETVRSTVGLTVGLLRTMKFRTDRMKLLSNRNFSTVTDLADLLVRERNLSFRTAHHLLAAIVDRMITEGSDAKGISAEVLNEEAVKLLGRPLDVDESLIREALDPENCVRRRKHLGGTAPEEVDRMAKRARIKVEGLRKNLETRRRLRRESEEGLLALARKRLKGQV